MMLAGTLITASFLSAYFISSSANRSTLFWSARTNLISGTVLSSRDLVAVPAALGHTGEKYAKEKSPLVGFLVLRNIKEGELFPAASLSSEVRLFKFVSVPISVQKGDLPKDLLEGALVSIYQVGDPHLASTISQPILVISKVFVIGIDKSGSNLGGSLSLTLSVPSLEVVNLLKATSAGRLVVIRVNG